MILYVYSKKSSQSQDTKIKYIESRLKEIYNDYTVIGYDDLDSIDLNCVNILIFSGGDGIFNQIVNKCYHYNHLIFGYIPLGTANDIAHNLDIKNIDESLDSIKNGVTKDINLLKVNDKYFVYALSVGPLSKVATKESYSLKRKLHKNVYKLKGMRYMFCKREQITFEIDNNRQIKKLQALLVLKSKYLGGVKIDNKVSDSFKVVLIRNIFDLIRIFIFKKTKGIETNSVKIESNSLWCIDGEQLFIEDGLVGLSNKTIKLFNK